jgi:antirestriction protein ArdC
MTKNDVYTSVTDRIIEALENGTVPWKKPWRVRGGPVNVKTRRPYRGINVFLLALAGYDDPRWGTYRAIQSCGGQVRKGEKGTRVILWKPVKAKGEDDEEDGAEKKGGYLLLRDYVVFNAEQADGLPEFEFEEIEFDPNERAQEIIDGYVEGTGPPLHHGGDRAYYNVLADAVTVPKQGDFDDGDSYYATVFHEFVHSTGHESRLKRIESVNFGSDPYAKEELVAEMGAAMLNGLAGIETREENSAAYVANWLRSLRDDSRLVINAAAAAQKAADWIVEGPPETKKKAAPKKGEKKLAVAA